MVRTAVLREVVRADAGAPVARADQRLPHVRTLLVQLLLLTLEQTRPQNPHRLIVVLALTPPVLTLHFHLFRRALLVPDANGRFGLVDVLPAGPAGPHPLPLNVRRFVDDDLRLFRLRHHRDRRGGRVDAALRFRRRDALDAVPAGLVPEVLVRVLAGHAEGDFLEPARFARAVRNLFQLPSLLAGVAGVHLVQVAGEQRGLVAAGAGADFDDHLGEVVRRIDQELLFDLRVERVALRPQFREFFFRHRLHVRVGGHRLGVRDRGAQALVLDVRFDLFGERAALLADGPGFGRVGADGGVVELLFQLAVARELLLENGEHGFVFGTWCLVFRENGRPVGVAKAAPSRKRHGLVKRRSQYTNRQRENCPARKRRTVCYCPLPLRERVAALRRRVRGVGRRVYREAVLMRGGDPSPGSKTRPPLPPGERAKPKAANHYFFSSAVFAAGAAGGAASFFAPPL